MSSELVQTLPPVKRVHALKYSECVCRLPSVMEIASSMDSHPASVTNKQLFLIFFYLLMLILQQQYYEVSLQLCAQHLA